MTSVACLTVGSRVAYDGGVWTVLALDGDRVTVEGRDSARTRSLRIAHLLSAPGSSLLDAPVAPSVEAVGPLLANLTDAELAAVCERASHVREVLTGYRAGSPEDALEGEPRLSYEPGKPLMDRYRAKADELGVGVTTVRRWVRAFQRDGETGLIDARHQRASCPTRGVDPRWQEVLLVVLDEHVGASRPTQALLLDRVRAGCRAAPVRMRSRSGGRRSWQCERWCAGRTRWWARRRPSAASRTVPALRMGG